MILSGSHVLVVGASRGIGAQLAREAAQRGARLTLVARSAEPLRQLAADLGGTALPADLADRADRRALLSRAEAAQGPVDVLACVASLDAVGSFLALTADELEQLYLVNLVACAELLRQALPAMVARGTGHAVVFSSGFSTVVSPGLAAYCSSKAGLSHLTGALRTELRGSGVAMTLVEPGPVRTSMYGDIQQERLSGAALRRLVRLRLTKEVEVDEVARAVCDRIEAGGGHVVVPRRNTPFSWFTRVPRGLSELVLTGLPRR